MDQTSKELLIKDLCGRLPYRVKIKTNFFKTATLISLRKHISLNSGKDLSISYDISGEDEPFEMDERWGTPISEIKPYLFPMESMTEEQKKELQLLMIHDSYGILYHTIDSFDYLYKNHIDIRGLIEKGLAIDATNLNIY